MCIGGIIVTFYNKNKCVAHPPMYFKIERSVRRTSEEIQVLITRTTFHPASDNY